MRISTVWLSTPGPWMLFVEASFKGQKGPTLHPPPNRGCDLKMIRFSLESERNTFIHSFIHTAHRSAAVQRIALNSINYMRQAPCRNPEPGQPSSARLVDLCTNPRPICALVPTVAVPILSVCQTICQTIFQENG